MNNKASHSLILLLAAAPFVFAQIPSGTLPAPAAEPASAELPGVTEALPSASDDDTGSPSVSPAAPPVVDEAAVGEPVAPPGLPGGSPDPAPVPGLGGGARISGGPPSITPAPAPLPPTPGRSPAAPAPELPPPTPALPSLPGLPPAPPPPVGVPAVPAMPPMPVAPRVMQPHPTSAAGAPPNVYFERKIEGNFKTPPTVVTVVDDPNAVAGNYAPAPRGEQVINDIKLKVLQRHYESALSEAVESEKAAIFASGGEKEALTAKAKALQEFAAKLETDIRALPGGARTAGAQNKMHVHGGSSSLGGFTPAHDYDAGRGNRFSTPAPALRVETVPGDGSGPVPVGPAPAEARSRSRSSR